VFREFVPEVSWYSLKKERFPGKEHRSIYWRENKIIQQFIYPLNDFMPVTIHSPGHMHKAGKGSWIHPYRSTLNIAILSLSVIVEEKFGDCLKYFRETTLRG